MSARQASQGISDATVRERTGRSWDEWFELLDSDGAHTLDHKGIVKLLAERHDLGSWWQQSVAVAYERARGLRGKHEMADGYQIGRSKTLPVPVEQLFRAWDEAAARSAWLAPDLLEVTRSTADRTLRGTWRADGSRVEVYFTAKGPEKSQVAVSHGCLGSAERAEEMKKFWLEQLEKLKSFLGH